MDRLSPTAQALLDAARATDDPTPEQRARGESAVRAALSLYGVTDLPPLSPPLEQAASAAASRTVLATRSKLALKSALAAALVMTASWIGLRERAATPRAAPPATAPAAVPESTAPSAVEAHSPAAGVGRSTEEDTFADPQPVPAARGTAQLAPHARASKPAAADDELAREVRLIARAHALEQAGRFDEALRVLDAHERRFPHGALSDERSALRVLSLCGRGPSERGSLERQRFLREAPNSVLWARVKAACASTPDSEP